MPSSTHITIVLLLSLLATANPTGSYGATSDLAGRQTTRCLVYSQLANLSTIGGNDTYRRAFYAASDLGTLTNQQLLAAAVQRIPPLAADPALNQACGNLTEIALVEAAKNFTRGIVAQFSGVDTAPPVLPLGFQAPFAIISAVLVFFLVFAFMP